MLVHTLTEDCTQYGNKLRLEMVECTDNETVGREVARIGLQIRVYVNDNPRQFRQIWAFSVEELEREFKKFIDGLKY